jgi:hypothetical protein
MKKLRRINVAAIVMLYLLVGVASAFGQSTFKYQSDIEGVPKSGFYKIHLQPGLIAKGNTDLSDLRIVNAKNAFVPFVRLQSLPSKTENLLVFPVVNSITKDSVTTIVIENKNRLLLQSLWINVKNTAVYRKADLLGSDDQQSWFAIQEDISLSQSTQSDQESFLQSLSFPASNYRFFKININNGKKEPLKVLQAGVFVNKRSAIEYAALPLPVFHKSDSSNNISYIGVDFKERFLISKLNIVVSSPKFYKRQVLIYKWEDNKKQLIGEATLESGSKQELSIGSKTNRLELQIQNGDNPPLQINKVEAFEVKEYIYAYLEAGDKYRLLLGDKNATMPAYDLQYFTDSLKNVSLLQHEMLAINALYKKAVKVEKTNYTPFVWIAIIAVLALLSFLCWKMMTEMKNRA